MTPARTLAVIAALAAVAGCLSAVPYVPVQRYDVAPAVDPEQRPGSAGVLAVRPLDYAQIYKTPIVFRTDAFKVAYRPHEEWAELPRETVTRALKDSLAATRFFDDVGDASNVSAPDYILNGELRRFDEVRSESPWQAACEVRIEVRRSGIPGTAVWAETYSRSVPVDGEGVGALAEAMSQAVSAIVATATEDVVNAIEGAPE